MRQLLVSALVTVLASVSPVAETTISKDYDTVIEKPVSSSFVCAFPITGEVPFVYKDEVIGFLKCNYVQKLSIYDWQNSKAVANDVLYSYAFNFTLELKKEFVEKNTLVWNVDGYFVQGEDVVGNSYFAGWSGYTNSIEVYPNKTSYSFEVDVQPNSLECKPDLQLDFTTSEGEKTSITVEGLALDKLKSSYGIHSAGEPVVIKSTTGAQYTFSIDKVCINKELGSEESKSAALDVEYTLRYDKGPKDTSITSKFGKESMSGVLSFYALSDNGDYHNYSEDLTLERQIPIYDRYGNLDKYESLAWYDKDNTVVLGKHRSMRTNRLMVSKFAEPLEYVRICVEFPEEITSLSKDSACRYVVYQIPLSQLEEVEVEEDE